VALGTPFRGLGDTPKRLRWLLLASLLLHTLLTPLVGWVGLFRSLLEEPEVVIEEEQLETIPIELFQAEEPATEPPDTAPELPAEDPVALIEELVPDPVALPVQPKPEPSAAPSAPPKPSASAEPTSKPEAIPEDAGAPAPSATSSAPEPSQTAPPSATAVPMVSATAPAPPRRIDGPIEAAGKAGKMVENQAYVSITLYADRIREHEVGQRIAAVLPSLPQWNDFFPDASLNPVRDFDRVVVVGPSFHDSRNVVALLQYNTRPEKVRAAVDTLVKRKGEWLSRAKVPVAKAFADRAERVFILPKPGLVVVVPPSMKDEMLAVRDVGIPSPKGPEAMEATLVNPHKPLARYGLQIPKSVKDARIRLTPLPNGEVKIELQAEDESPEAADRTAREVSAGINAIADLSAGFSGLLEIAGFGRSVRLPRVELHASGKEIWGEQVLSREQVDFLLSQFERQALAWSRARERSARPSPAPTRTPGSTPAPPRGGVRSNP
jgi:hypothetical protein